MKRVGRRGVRRRQKSESESESEKELLPQEMINEILMRLPVKSLVKFKSVSKSWLSQISDPHFAISHFALAAARTDRLMFLAPLSRKFLSIDPNASLHDNSASAALNLDKVLPPNSSYLEIVGSCRGFLLLNRLGGLCVWNPSTGVHSSLSRSPASHADLGISTFLRGFGYDPSTDDYLVVQATYNTNHRQYDRVTHVEYFSFRANEWKELDPEATHLFYKQASNYNQIGCLCNDAIHWLAFRYDVSVDVIVGFQLTERSILEISMPVDFESNNFQICLLRVLRELFSLCAVGRNSSVEIWVMEEYRVRSSWTKTIVVSVENVPRNRYFFPICSTKSGDVVGTDLRTGLVKCNDQGQLQEHRSYFIRAHVHAVAVYTESLLSLPCDS